MTKPKDGCVKAARGPIAAAVVGASVPSTAVKEAPMMRAQVGREAPDFELNAFVGKEGFRPVRLSDYRGKWVVLCFYPGDFTFV